MKNKNNERLYDLIFPVWLILFFPPFIFPAMIANLIIDGVVIVGVLWWTESQIPTKQLLGYILKAWAWGFLADVIGSVILTFTVPPFISPLALIGVFISGALIYAFNRWLALKYELAPGIASTMAKTMAIITAPWAFLIPLELFQKWFNIQ